MSGFTSRSGHSSAPYGINGTVSSGADWTETYNFQTDGGVVHDDADIWTWQFNFRTDYGASPDLSLSTTAGTITVTNTADATAFAIDVPYSDLTAMEGDYIADIAYEDASGNRIHWAHGMVTFRNEPIWSS
jgi:hypothetical protein